MSGHPRPSPSETVLDHCPIVTNIGHIHSHPYGRRTRPGLGFDSLEDDFDEAADELEEMRVAFERREARTIALEKENARLGAEITAWHDSALRLETGPKPWGSLIRDIFFSFLLLTLPSHQLPPFTQHPNTEAAELRQRARNAMHMANTAAEQCHSVRVRIWQSLAASVVTWYKSMHILTCCPSACNVDGDGACRNGGAVCHAGTGKRRYRERRRPCLSFSILLFFVIPARPPVFATRSLVFHPGSHFPPAVCSATWAHVLP